MIVPVWSSHGNELLIDQLIIGVIPESILRNCFPGHFLVPDAIASIPSPQSRALACRMQGPKMGILSRMKYGRKESSCSAYYCTSHPCWQLNISLAGKFKEMCKPWHRNTAQGLEEWSTMCQLSSYISQNLCSVLLTFCLCWLPYSQVSRWLNVGFFLRVPHLVWEKPWDRKGRNTLCSWGGCRDPCTQLVPTLLWICSV